MQDENKRFDIIEDDPSQKNIHAEPARKNNVNIGNLLLISTGISAIAGIVAYLFIGSVAATVGLAIAGFTLGTIIDFAKYRKQDQKPSNKIRIVTVKNLNTVSQKIPTIQPEVKKTFNLNQVHDKTLDNYIAI